MHERDRRNKRHSGEPPQEPPKPRKSLVMQTPVLVLNASYEPINICAARRAIVLVLKGLAMPEEHPPARSQHLPVLRCGAAFRRAYPGPRGPAFARRVFHLGKPGGLLPFLQPPKG
jgi:hypothetical protein